MSDLLFLARDYTEQMANPIYGVATNEEYAIRFATLLRSQEFKRRLNHEIESLSDPGTLTSYGWLWLFGWAKSEGIELKENLLITLYEKWSSVFFRVAIVDLATQNLSDYRPRTERPSIENFPNRFLSQIMSEATRSRNEDAGLPTVGGPPDRPGTTEGRLPIEEQRLPEPVPSTALAESTLVALLQVGKRITIDAAGVLLRQSWEGQAQLLESFYGIYNALDADTQAVWTQQLNPPTPEQSGPVASR